VFYRQGRQLRIEIDEMWAGTDLALFYLFDVWGGRLGEYRSGEHWDVACSSDY
jgi:hypothetical protein